MIKAIFWDIGGVVILSRRKQILEDWAKELDVSSDNLRVTLKQFSDQKMRGQNISYNDFIQVNQISWITGEQLENLQKSLWNSEYVNNELLDFILANKDKYVYGVITNNYKEAEEVILKKYQVPKFYTIFVSSADIGVLKPDRKIYEFVLKRVNLPADQCLFIDDSEKNVAIAQKLGIPTVIFQGQKDIESKFRKLGILF